MLRWTVAFQLIAALHVYGRVCLPDAIPEFERKNVTEREKKGTTKMIKGFRKSVWMHFEELKGSIGKRTEKTSIKDLLNSQLEQDPPKQIDLWVSLRVGGQVFHNATTGGIV